jgi:RND family efflux transporter MFP subunit
VYVAEKTRVAMGQVLAKLYSSDAEYALKNIQNQIETQKIAGAQRDVDLLVLQEKTALQSLEECFLRAPIAGIVSEVTITAGDMVGSGSASSYVKVVDISRYQAVAEIDELDAVSVKLGQKANVTFDAMPGKPYSGEVYSIPVEGKVSSQSIGVVDVILTFTGLPAEIKTGFSFSGQIILNSGDQILVVPKTAVIQRNGKSTVIIPAKNGSQPERRDITVSDYSTDQYKVEAGLEAGDVIVAVVGAQGGANSSRSGGTQFPFPVGPQGGGNFRRD